jgi:hypothetical protein
MSLARDALVSGDTVTAESYLQHAEHYNRIIMAAQAQFGAQHGGHQGEGQNGAFRQPRWNESPDDDGGEFEGGGEIRAGETRGSQDRERHEGNREHHQGRQGGNGREAPRDHDANGADQPEAQGDETAPDQVS